MNIKGLKGKIKQLETTRKGFGKNTDEYIELTAEIQALSDELEEKENPSPKRKDLILQIKSLDKIFGEAVDYSEYTDGQLELHLVRLQAKKR